MPWLGKRSLQVCVAAAGLVPVVAGASGALLDHAGSGALTANHERYLSGLLLAIGLAFWASLPDIERRAARIRLLTFLVVVGGLCRLLGVAMGDALSLTVLGALVMELVVTPLLCYWQSRLGSGSGGDV